MPTYSYACTACDHRFDAVQAFSDDALTACPNCSGRLRKLFGSVGVVFKGSGFYRNDSRGAESKSADGGSGSGEKSGAKAGEKASEKSSEKSGDKSSDKGGGPASSSGSGSKGDSKPAGSSSSSSSSAAATSSS